MLEIFSYDKLSISDKILHLQSKISHRHRHLTQGELDPRLCIKVFISNSKRKPYEIIGIRKTFYNTAYSR